MSTEKRVSGVSEDDYMYHRDKLIELDMKLEKLTGHAFDCEIQVDPEWKPCTCGRG